MYSTNIVQQLDSPRFYFFFPFESGIVCQQVRPFQGGLLLAYLEMKLPSFSWASPSHGISACYSVSFDIRRRRGFTKKRTRLCPPTDHPASRLLRSGGTAETLLPGLEWSRPFGGSTKQVLVLVASVGGSCCRFGCRLGCRWRRIPGIGPVLVSYKRPTGDEGQNTNLHEVQQPRTRDRHLVMFCNYWFG